MTTTSTPAPFLPIEKRTIASSVVPEAIKRRETLSDGSSTSAGSSSLASDISHEESNLASPVNWRIRNTFLDTKELTLLQGFQRSRRSRSCPAGGREAFELEEISLTPDDAPVEEMESHAHRMDRAQTVPDCSQNVPRPLALAELVGPQPHSTGSVLHFQGTCKPCAFFWKVVGCKYGTECEFCHLCDADERKRRNKDKRMAMHALQSGGRSHVMGGQSRHSRCGRLASQ